MNGRERFMRTMNYELPDRPPLFEDGIREEVVRIWRKQSLGKKDKLESLFTFDIREEVEPNLEPSPMPAHWPTNFESMEKLASRLDPKDPKRLPENWENKVLEWKNRDYPLILRVHRGFFLSMGVHGWHRFTDAARLLVDNPDFVQAWLNICAKLSSELIERILQELQVDAALFSEPIGGNHGPLISPTMYSKIVLKSYQPIIDVLHSYNVKTIIYRTYANTRVLLPSVIKIGFNCLWACECNPHAMDYSEIRREYGKDLKLIGGIDSDTLRQNTQEIRKVVMDLVPRLLDDGGYIPLADGRVREDVPFENYMYYRKLLESITSGVSVH